MAVKFKNKSGNWIFGSVIFRGWINVDGPEVYEVQVAGVVNHAFVPVVSCELV